METKNTIVSFIILIVILVAGGIWYHFGIGWALVFSLCFMSYAAFLIHNAVKSSDSIIIIHPDIQGLVSEEELQKDTSMTPEQFHMVMEHYREKYGMGTDARSITRDRLQQRLSQRVTARETSLEEQEQLKTLEKMFGIDTSNIDEDKDR